MTGRGVRVLLLRRGSDGLLGILPRRPHGPERRLQTPPPRRAARPSEGAGNRAPSALGSGLGAAGAGWGAVRGALRAPDARGRLLPGCRPGPASGVRAATRASRGRWGRRASPPLGPPLRALSAGLPAGARPRPTFPRALRARASLVSPCRRPPWADGAVTCGPGAAAPSTPWTARAGAACGRPCPSAPRGHAAAAGAAPSPAWARTPPRRLASSGSQGGAAPGSGPRETLRAGRAAPGPAAPDDPPPSRAARSRSVRSARPGSAALRLHHVLRGAHPAACRRSRPGLGVPRSASAPARPPLAAGNGARLVEGGRLAGPPCPAASPRRCGSGASAAGGPLLAGESPGCARGARALASPGCGRRRKPLARSPFARLLGRPALQPWLKTHRRGPGARSQKLVMSSVQLCQHKETQQGGQHLQAQKMAVTRKLMNGLATGMEYPSVPH
ncbi:collagen alpha-1(I) chain-like [Sorex araneus]|uniref:collagen alpha-1(I) chain-like n=1 Tax=Sorex araneus TaxID=42254 RepID=UPI002433F5DA|nr:collagen alpha-1(I) chain-like [Sorex araneus]